MHKIKIWIARKLFSVEIEKFQKVIFTSFSKDEYGQGFYNGFQYAKSMIVSCEPKYMSLEEFKGK